MDGLNYDLQFELSKYWFRYYPQVWLTLLKVSTSIYHVQLDTLRRYRYMMIDSKWSNRICTFLHNYYDNYAQNGIVNNKLIDRIKNIIKYDRLSTRCYTSADELKTLSDNYISKKFTIFDRLCKYFDSSNLLQSNITEYLDAENLYLGVHMNDLIDVKFLINTYNIPFYDDVIHRGERKYYTLLSISIKNNNYEITTILIENGHVIDYSNILDALSLEDDRTIKLLLENVQEPIEHDEEDMDTLTGILRDAISSCYNEEYPNPHDNIILNDNRVKLFIKYGADINQSDMLLHELANNQYITVDTIKILINNGTHIATHFQHSFDDEDNEYDGNDYLCLTADCLFITKMKYFADEVEAPYDFQLASIISIRKDFIDGFKYLYENHIDHINVQVCINKVYSCDSLNIFKYLLETLNISKDDAKQLVNDDSKIYEYLCLIETCT